ncbi:MAG: hypothetical protein IKA26_03745 [Alistipes sp.]|nr:hypothetical protein [Alistipes sp.]
MKRIIYSLVAIVSLLAVSCVQEDTSVTQPIGSEALVSISVGNGSASRSIAQGEDTNELLYAVYDSNWNLLFTRDVELPATLTYKVEEKLLTGYTYHFVFWAQKEGTYTPEWGTVGQVSDPYVTINYANANDDSRDAFFGQVEVAVQGTTNESVELKRPFAQINHGTNDLAKAADAGFNTAALTTSLKVSAYNTLYLNGGGVDGLTDVTFVAAARDTEMTTLNTDYDWISMNYVLWTAEESSLGECTLTITDGVKTIGVKYPQAPARRNYRTNLLGALLTDSANVNVEVKPGTEGDLNNPNGYYIKDGVYHIQNATGLDWLAEQVNGGNSFSGVKIVLDGDIDLSATRATTYTEWTPIGTSDHAFSGSFDGSGYTVRNFQVTALEGHAGLFGYITLGGPIQNLTVENVKIVANHYAGGIVGRGYVNIENCHVNNVDITLSVKNNDWSDKAGGVIGQMMEGSSTTKNCTAKNVSIKGYRDLGGIAGMAHNNNTVTGCSVENITIVQDLSVDYEAATPTTLGGVVGRQGSNVTYENNTETNVNIGTGANNETEMKAAIAANAATIIVNGEIDLAQVNLNNYCGTIVGADDTAALSTRNYTPGNNEGYWLINGAENHSITFKNIDIKFPTGGDWLKSGFASRGTNATLVFDHCDFEGQATLNGGATWTFNDCNFVSTELDKYASFVYGAKKATFNRCSFSGVDRAAKVYGSGGVLDVEYNTCEYTSSTLNKSGVEIDASYATTTVNLNNCSQTAMAGLYALKGAKGTVYVDGELEYLAGYGSVADGYYELNNCIHILNSNGLAHFSGATIPANVTEIKLEKDIDMLGAEFVGMANANQRVNLVFNGNDKTISNIKFKTAGHYGMDTAAGLFDSVTMRFDGSSFECKDLTLSNVSFVDEVNSKYAGAIIGYAQIDSPGQFKLTNVHVKNSNLKGLASIGGMIGMLATPASLYAKDCSVANTTIEATQKRAAAFVAMTNSPVDVTPIVFENCVVGSDVTITAPEGTESVYIGENYNNSTVTIK